MTNVEGPDLVAQEKVDEHHRLHRLPEPHGVGWPQTLAIQLISSFGVGLRYLFILFHFDFDRIRIVCGFLCPEKIVSLSGTPFDFESLHVGPDFSL